MAKDERQRKLQSQYFFGCQCVPCKDNWPIYTGLSTSAVPLPGTQPDQVHMIYDWPACNNTYDPDEATQAETISLTQYQVLKNLFFLK